MPEQKRAQPLPYEQWEGRLSVYDLFAPGDARAVYEHALKGMQTGSQRWKLRHRTEAGDDALADDELAAEKLKRLQWAAGTDKMVALEHAYADGTTVVFFSALNPQGCRSIVPVHIPASFDKIWRIPAATNKTTTQTPKLLTRQSEPEEHLFWYKALGGKDQNQ